jgi:aspartyl/asparaginyl beta-hydroxylase (cupin superfamily)
MQHLHAVQSKLAEAQSTVESFWPIPLPGSTFNLSIRDVIATTLIAVVLGLFLKNKLVLKSYGLGAKLLCVLAVIALEPAALALPYNVLHSLIYRSPRYWHPLVVEPMLQKLLDYFPKLQAEALQIVRGNAQGLVNFSDVNTFQRRIAEHQPWKVFPFFSYGTRNDANCSRAPITASILEQIPTVRLAMYSVMSGGAEIPMHCGFYKSALRVHLTLYVDEEDTDKNQRYIEVGGQKYSWQTGELVAFDDTYPHRVINKVRGTRIVLFLDVDRPYSSIVEQTIANGMTFVMKQSPNIQKIANNQEKTRLI